ncbi:MFS general substrate transporter [Metschnikowia bicuspidata var. bicuspidata NRRL YB-4993]|uniref:MFS general substrate transporter n=1 Tax=Metschnikowia bicuspidata var. bicuspidata NRRL YB-4993 TaxID=869754 RepID=A0A1A0HFV1_9ASCO|nr:MFS general substrate transporter [Metschnikowia bicuspidata var. bicuspidata NRRL YB-4993]OBA22733.1 MFS general substrate transporter [Metschnikowia bicuspidata var. bicuspidata NRRL YB-4993]
MVDSSSDVDHTEIVCHSWAEIEASGNWYDRRYVSWIPPFSHSTVQIVLMSFVIFLTPGCFNAITGIGNSGISDPTVADNANVALYSTFATVGAIGGVVCNTIGVRACLVFGGTGYIMYTLSLLVYHYKENAGFCIFAGAYLGVSASFTWAAQGSIIMSYALENKKAHAIMIFWVIFNFGAVIGSIIPLVQNLESGESNVNAGTYVAFLVLMGCGVLLACFLLPMDKVYKPDGSKVIAKKHPRLRDEIRGMIKVLVHEPKIYFMFPMFCALNFFYTYQFNEFNAVRFNVRTRSLNSLLYWFSQMVGAIVLGLMMDSPRFSRPTRARIGYAVLTVTSLAIWGGGLKFQIGVTRETDVVLIDFKDGLYIGPMFLYMFYGAYDAVFQSFIFWVLGTFSNNPKKVALYASFYKSLQSAFSAIAWRLDAIGVPYMSMFAASWGLVQGSLLIAAPLVLFMITETTDPDKDGIDEIMEASELRSVTSHPQKV